MGRLCRQLFCFVFVFFSLVLGTEHTLFRRSCTIAACHAFGSKAPATRGIENHAATIHAKLWKPKALFLVPFSGSCSRPRSPSRSILLIARQLGS